MYFAIHTTCNYYNLTSFGDCLPNCRKHVIFAEQFEKAGLVVQRIE